MLVKANVLQHTNKPNSIFRCNRRCYLLGSLFPYVTQTYIKTAGEG